MRFLATRLSLVFASALCCTVPTYGQVGVVAGGRNPFTGQPMPQPPQMNPYTGKPMAAPGGPPAGTTVTSPYGTPPPGAPNPFTGQQAPAKPQYNPYTGDYEQPFITQPSVEPGSSGPSGKRPRSARRKGPTYNPYTGKTVPQPPAYNPMVGKYGEPMATSVTLPPAPKSASGPEQQASPAPAANLNPYTLQANPAPPRYNPYTGQPMPSVATPPPSGPVAVAPGNAGPNQKPPPGYNPYTGKVQPRTVYNPYTGKRVRVR